MPIRRCTGCKIRKDTVVNLIYIYFAHLVLVGPEGQAARCHLPLLSLHLWLVLQLPQVLLLPRRSSQQ